MKKIIIASTLLFTVQLSYAQTDTKTLTGQAAQDNLNALTSDNINTLVRVHDNRYEGVKGTPYFLEQWGETTITTLDNKVYANIPTKYNVLENNLVYRNEKGTAYIFDAKYIEGFAIKDPKLSLTYTFQKLKNFSAKDAKLADRFFLMVHDGPKTGLALLVEKELIKADFKGGYSANRTFDEIHTKEIYYFIENGKEAQKVKLNKKKLIELLFDKKSEIEGFIKAENVDANTAEGWRRVLVFYETL